MKKYFISSFILIGMFTPCKAQPIKLSLNLKQGNTYYMVGNSNSSILQTINGKENKVDIGLIYRIAFKVTGLTDSAYNMEVRYQTLNMKIKIADNTVEMDSKKNDKQDIPSTIIATMMNRPFTIVILKNGKIRSIKNVEKMITDVLDNFSQVDAAKKEQIKSQLLQSFGGNAFKGNLELETAIFPESAVIKNDEWVVDTKLESAFKMNVHTTYQLVGVEANAYHIRGSGTLFTDKNSKPSQLNGLSMRYNITGTSADDIKVDKATGWITEVKVKRILKGNIEIQDNPRVPGGMNIPMISNTDVTTTGK